ncbi:hypothetical protein PENTCL1PPCAC_23224, partial [Pristionchus entomophagus]
IFQWMDEVGGISYRLRDGRGYPSREMVKFTDLMTKHASLLNSADADTKKRGWELVNDEGRDCSRHLQDELCQVADELSTLSKHLAEYSRSFNLESMYDEEDDGGMENKTYEQIVEYLKTGKIPYENYKHKHNAEQHWPRKCVQYTLADDGQTKKIDGAIVLKKGEVNNALRNFHQVVGDISVNEMQQRLEKFVNVVNMKRKIQDYLASCSCGYAAEVNPKGWFSFIEIDG